MTQRRRPDDRTRLLEQRYAPCVEPRPIASVFSARTCAATRLTPSPSVSQGGQTRSVGALTDDASHFNTSHSKIDHSAGHAPRFFTAASRASMKSSGREPFVHDQNFGSGRDRPPSRVDRASETWASIATATSPPCNRQFGANARQAHPRSKANASLPPIADILLRRRTNRRSIQRQDFEITTAPALSRPASHLRRPCPPADARRRV